MLEQLRIKNFKSVMDVTVDLGRTNVFIGENGCGKTNILEGLAMLSAAKTGTLSNEELYARGVRIAKPSITFSSFLGKAQNESVHLECVLDDGQRIESLLRCRTPNDIYSDWSDSFMWSREIDEELNLLDSKTRPLREEVADLKQAKKYFGKTELYRHLTTSAKQRHAHLEQDLAGVMRRVVAVAPVFKDYLVFNLNQNALRGIHSESRKVPLGIHGEGLDVLISQLDKEEHKRLLEYSHFVSWLEDILIDRKDRLKFEGHKLGKSNSLLYFRDRFMQRKNSVFSAENANEGVLHVLFYLTLFISKRTPKLFGIDNIETALNPQLCRTLMKELATLAAECDKQALITTHNPAVLDGLNLHDDQQRLFVVDRNDDGHTRVKRIQMKEKVEADGRTLKLSELWMRGHLGGLPQNF